VCWAGGNISVLITGAGLGRELLDKLFGFNRKISPRVLLLKLALRKTIFF
jgi:hypothetical protein